MPARFPIPLNASIAARFDEVAQILTDQNANPDRINALIAGYLGSARLMDDAVTEFAVDYADQNHRDYRLCVRAIRQGRLKAKTEE